MDWLPGTSIFRHHTWVFWLNLLAGMGLGAAAGHLRAAGTIYEGRGWVLALATVAGALLGFTIFLTVSFLSLLSALRSGDARAGPVAVFSLLGQLGVFTVFVVRRRSP